MKTYYNLTQTKGKRMVYFRSTDLEQKNWERLLWSVPDEWLYLIYKGKKIKVVDKSTKPRGKIERIFVPVLNDLINYLSFNLPPKNKALSYHFNRALDILGKSKSLRTKFEFWTDINKNLSDIKAKTIKVKRERNLK